MSELYYSHDEEQFTADIEDAIDYVFDYSELKIGDIRAIYEGEKQELKASFFFGRLDIIDRLQENAYDYFQNNDLTDSWLQNVTDEQENELIQSIKDTIDVWADKHKKQPTFFGIKNVKEIKVKFVGDTTESKDYFVVVENNE